MQSFSKAILLLGGNRAYCRYSIPLHNAIESNVTVFRAPSHFTHSFQPSDEDIFGPLNIYFKNEATACKITRYLMARLIGFAWSTFDSVSGCISDFESTGMYPFNSNIAPEYFFSINDASGSINSMEATPPCMAIVCVNSIPVTIFQILLLIAPEPLSSNLSTMFSSDTSPEEITYSILLIKIRPLREIPRICSIHKSKSLFPQ